jgi:hypothetical protein
MLDPWEIVTAPDEYTPGTFKEEMQKYLSENK